MKITWNKHVNWSVVMVATFGRNDESAVAIIVNEDGDGYPKSGR